MNQKTILCHALYIGFLALMAFFSSCAGLKSTSQIDHDDSYFNKDDLQLAKQQAKIQEQSGPAQDQPEYVQTPNLNSQISQSGNYNSPSSLQTGPSLFLSPWYVNPGLNFSSNLYNPYNQWNSPFSPFGVQQGMYSNSWNTGFGFYSNYRYDPFWSGQPFCNAGNGMGFSNSPWNYSPFYSGYSLCPSYNTNLYGWNNPFNSWNSPYANWNVFPSYSDPNSSPSPGSGPIQTNQPMNGNSGLPYTQNQAPNGGRSSQDMGATGGRQTNPSNPGSTTWREPNPNGRTYTPPSTDQNEPESPRSTFWRESGNANDPFRGNNNSSGGRSTFGSGSSGTGGGSSGASGGRSGGGAPRGGRTK